MNKSSRLEAECFPSSDDQVDLNDNSSRDQQCLRRQQHSLAVVSLCLCSLANAFVIVSVFPYSGYMVLDLLPNTTPEQVGAYAGFLAASFMFGRFLTAYTWGNIADTYGRVACLQASMILSAIFSVLFGLSTSYRMAILCRLCLGASNSVTSTCKTLASEISPTEKLEQRAMGLVVGMRSWGFLLGPAIGGFLAEPMKQYSYRDVAWLAESWWGNHILTIPFLLPNMVVATFCIFSSISIYFFVEETLNDRIAWSLVSVMHTCYLDIQSAVKICCGPFSSTKQNRSAGETLSLLPYQNNALYENDDSGISSILGIEFTRSHLVAMWIFSFVVVVIDEAFPLFCMSTIGGLSLEESSIGKILSLAGLLFALCQYVIYTTVVDRVGIYRSIDLGGFFGLVPAALVPISVWMDSHGQPPWLIFGYLSILLGVTKVMICICFTSLAIATNKTVPSNLRAKMNGLAVIGSSITKGLGPIFAGLLVSSSLSPNTFMNAIPPQFGSLLIFGTIGLLGIGSSCLLSRLKNNNDDADERGR